MAALAAPARADVCDDAVIDPAPVALRAGGFDGGRSACLRSDLDLRLDAHALIDTPGFYGTLGGGLRLGVRFVERVGFEWGATLQVADVTFAQTAVLAVTEAGYGPVGLHAAVSRATSLAGRDLRLGGVVGFELPFTRSALDASSAGGQLAGLATWEASDRVVIHGRLGVLGWYGASAGGTSTRGAIAASADAAVRTWSWLRAFGGLEVQGGWYGGGLDHVALRLGAHWRLRGPWQLDAAAAAPLVGAERTDVAFTFGLRHER
ncbi:MAG: hypothetical protein H6708_12150 [Kofleriaceae bacterium]|nr:hypothetical protein [Kofleriaceae bacterium]